MRQCLAYIILLVAASAVVACSKPDIHDTTTIRSRACTDCHATAYNAATNPPHVNVLAQTCGDCHSTTAWIPATVSTHPWFTLDGAHLATACTHCHAGTPSTFVGVPTVCSGCHLGDYEASTYPGHSTFPKTCADCHTTTSWATASAAGMHPEAKFPITTGPHSLGVGCADCHVAALGSPIQGANCDCVHCHLGAHNTPAIDSAHVSLGAAYTPSGTAAPNACRVCHLAG